MKLITTSEEAIAKAFEHWHRDSEEGNWPDRNTGQTFEEVGKNQAETFIHYLREVG